MEIRTDRQTQRKKERQIDKQKDRNKDIQTNRRTDTQLERQKDTQIQKGILLCTTVTLPITYPLTETHEHNVIPIKPKELLL